MKESKTLEFKATITNTFLKTVSAFANYGSGSILFGIDDDGKTLGIENPDQACLDIENKINDSIDPNPDYTLAATDNGVIELNVREGSHKPYLYKAKAYRRNDTSTIEVDRIELSRLILEGQNLTFEEMPARKKNLSFSRLEKALRASLKIDSLTDDMLKTLELENVDGTFNIAGELIADENPLPGVDIARFGDSIDVFLDRRLIQGVSILQQYDEAITFFKRYYEFERVEGTQRETIQTIPETAFREAIANALVHRQWDTPANIRVSMHLDRIEVTSPGGLPQGLSEEEYLNGQISTLRNPIVGNVLFRLGLIERFGTGVLRIKESYRDSVSKPQFKIYEKSITVTLPLLDAEHDLDKEEKVIVRILRNRQLSMSAIVTESGYGRSKAQRILKQLATKGRITITGNGRGTKYQA